MKKYIPNIAHKIDQYRFSTPIILLLFTILAFAPLIPFLGFYWDGLPYLWQYKVFGPAGYPEFVASDRPYSAFIFMFLTQLFGTKAIFYHIFTLLCRWLAGWAFWWILQQVWKENRVINIYAAILFILYPGFLQQPIALPYAHHFSHLALFLFSMGIMLAATINKKKRWIFTILGLLSQLVIFSLEYFASLEFIRPILIWIMIKDQVPDTKERLKYVMKTWLPYLLVLVTFYVWRVFFFSFPTYEPKMLNELSQDFSTGVFGLLTQAVKDIYTVTIGALGGLFHFPSVPEVGYFATYGYWGITAIAFLFGGVVLLLLEAANDQRPKKNTDLQYLLIGFIAILFAGAIFWVTKLAVRIEFAWDRLTLAYMFGVALVFTGVIFFILRQKTIRVLFTTCLLSLTVGFHFMNAMDFKHDWDTFKDFFWQLSWRIPDLEENTIVLTTNFPLKYYSDNSLTAPLNWTYAPESADEKLAYVFYYSDVRLKVGRLQALEKDLPVHQWYRSFSFDGNTSDTVVIRYDPPGCVQVLDDVYANAGIIPNLSSLEADGIPLSNLDRIITDPAVEKFPPFEIVGEEIPRGWCYYFEKADLARQTQDWDKVIALREQAQAQDLYPRNPSEWLPFIEAYIQTGHWENAMQLMQASLDVEMKYKNGILYTWQRLEAEISLLPPADFLTYINDLQE